MKKSSLLAKKSIGRLTGPDRVAAYVRANGPYDAVLGFSLGGSVAATLLLRPDEPVVGHIRRQQLRLIKLLNAFKSTSSICGTPHPTDIIGFYILRTTGASTRSCTLSKAKRPRQLPIILLFGLWPSFL